MSFKKIEISEITFFDADGNELIGAGAQDGQLRDRVYPASAPSFPTEISRLQFAVVGRTILCAGDEINNKCDVQHRGDPRICHG